MQTLALSIATLFSIVFGVFTAKSSINSGMYFVNALIGAAAFGPFMYGGFTWYDESFLIGFLGLMFFHQIKFPLKASLRRQKIYFSFLVYFMFEFLNGIYFFYNHNEDILRKFRWLLFLVLLLIVSSLANLNKKNEFKVTTGQLQSIILFLFVYLASNYIVLLKTGSAGYAQYAQVPKRGYLDAIWANTAYVTLSIFLFTYIALMGIIQKSSTNAVILCKIILILNSFIFGLTLSRGGFFLSVLILAVYFISQAAWKRPVNSLAILTIMLVPMVIGLNASGKGNLSGFSSDIKNTVLVVTDENRSTGREFDRIQQYTELTKVTNVSFNDPEILYHWQLLFGHGIRTSGLVLAIANNDFDQTKYSNSFTPSIPIEFGIIGVFIFLLIIIEAFKNIFRKKIENRLLVSTLLLGAVLTTFVVNNFDYIPLYMILSCSTFLSKYDS